MSAPNPLIVRRSAACGDAIQSFPIVTALRRQGINAFLQTQAAYLGLLYLSDIPPEFTGGHPHVNLDDAYEREPELRKRTGFTEIYRTTTNQQLAGLSIHLRPEEIDIPRMRRFIDPGLRDFFLKHARPWTLVAPRSSSPHNGEPRSGAYNLNANRTVPDEIWSHAAHLIRGTVFWAGIHAPAPEGIVDCRVTHLMDLAACISLSDVLASVDSAPRHIAGAMGVPQVVIMQAYDPDFTFQNCPSRVKVWPSLPCVPCTSMFCPINRDRPPCQQVDPSVIAQAVNSILP